MKRFAPSMRGVEFCTSSATSLSSKPVTSASLSAKPGSKKDTDVAPVNILVREKATTEAHVFGSETSRSSTPVTDLSSWCPSSRSSFATSVQPDGENGCPNKDGTSAERSDVGSEYISAEMKSLNDADMAAAKSALNPRMLRQSQLRHSMSTSPTTPGDSTSLSGSETGADVGEDDDDDYGGDNDSLDVAIIAAVDGDLSLAAFLIPLLHKDLRNAVKRKIDSWQIDTEALGNEPEDGNGSGSSRGGGSRGTSGRHGGSASSGSNSHGHSSDQARKRRRHRSESENERDEDDEQGGNGGIGFMTDLERSQIPYLACPFHKLNPLKYGIQHGGNSSSARQDSYRACAGPGFKTIQRLKEHLKRKHTPVQCDRCYHVFTGGEKTACINELMAHRQRDVPCQRGDPLMKEGISEAQWAALDNKSRKKNQEMHKVEKWFEIWKVLFPDEPEPDTPWYNDAVPMRCQTPSRESEAFADLFYTMLSHKLQMGDMGFPDCNTEEVAQRLRNLVQQTFRTYVSLNGPLSRTTDASSSQTGTNQLPTVGGSSTHQSNPTNSTSQNHTARTSGSLLSVQGQQMPLGHMQVPMQSGVPYAMPTGMTALTGVAGVPVMHRRVTGQHIQFAPVMAATGSTGTQTPMTTAMASAGLLPDEYFVNPAMAAALAQWQAGSMTYGGTAAGAAQYGDGGFYSGPVNGYMQNNDGSYSTM